jgi:Flp pilus assembly protein TadD
MNGKTLFVAILSFVVSGCLLKASIHPEAERLNSRGAALMTEGRFHEAGICFGLSLEYSPCMAEALHNLAVLALLEKDLDEADRREREAIACRPDLVQAITGMGAVSWARGKIEEAIAHFEKAIEMDPGCLDARRNLVLAYLKVEDLRRARIHADRLQVLSPGDAVVAMARDRTRENRRKEK